MVGLAIWGTLTALVVARGALVFVPDMRGWGLNLLRFLPPASAVLLWSIAAAALVPGWARFGVEPLTRLGDAIGRGSRGVAILLGAGAALLAWLAPDRVRFLGDFLLRQGTVETALRPAELFPQELPLDIFLHHQLPLFLSRAGVFEPATTARILGSVEAGCFAIVAAGLARALGLTGIAATSAFALSFFGGHLALLTGYPKGLAELCLLVAVVAVFAIRMLRTGRGGAGLALILAAGLFLHRGVIVVLPAALVVYVLTWRNRATAANRYALPAALAILACAMIAMLPRIVSTLVSFDATHHIARSASSSAFLAFPAVRWLDLANALLLLSPVAPILPMLVLATRGKVPQGKERWFLIVFLVPCLALVMGLQPQQGEFRDWDTFAPTAVALTLATAWVAAETLQARADLRWLGVAAIAAAISSTGALLLHQTNADWGVRRIEAYLREAPRRPDDVRAKTWDFLGAIHFRAARWERAFEAYRQGAEAIPNPRYLYQWGFMATRAGDLREARTAFQKLVERDPDNVAAWESLARVAEGLGDRSEIRRASLQVLRLRPGDPNAERRLKALEALDTGSPIPPGAGQLRGATGANSDTS